VKFGDMKLTILEATIAKDIGLPSSGDKYFKGLIVDRKLCQKIIRSEHHDLDWTKGIPQSCIKEEYWMILISL
jgi:hypothetical protein